MKIKIFPLLLSAFIFLSGCSTNNLNNISPPTPSPTEPTIPEIIYLTTLGTTSAKYKEITEKYSGQNIESLVIKNSDTDLEIDVSSTDKIKVIELYSGYCDTCKATAPFVQELEDLNKENIDWYMVSKEKNSKEIENMRESGYSGELWYFPGDIPAYISKTLDIGKPSYIILDSNNNILHITGGNLNIATYEIILSSIKDSLIKFDLQDSDEGGEESGDCATC